MRLLEGGCGCYRVLLLFPPTHLLVQLSMTGPTPDPGPAGPSAVVVGGPSLPHWLRIIEALYISVGAQQAPSS